MTVVMAPDTSLARKTRAPVPMRLARQHILLLIALLIVVVYHGGLLLSGSFQGTYDAYVHIFFADHYARDWFSSWDDRWYTGFSVFSYPPGAHQAIAALSFLFGLQGGFVIVQLFAVLNLTIGVYRWAGIWVPRVAAGWAAVLLVLSSSIAETIHVFGQLPTTLSLGFLLQALPFAYRWVRTGGGRQLLAAVTCVMATTACHHVTTLFGAVFFLGPVLVFALVTALREPAAGEPDGHPPQVSRALLWPLIARRLRRVMPSLRRTMVLGGLVVAALILVVLPYWLHTVSDPITQVSIPHASRDNFLVNLNAGLVFWLIPWGLMLLALPYALVRGFSSKIWPLAASLAALTFLGTGGTTPFPKILLGGAYQILTLDRFTFWATICILPLAGLFVTSLTSGTVREWLMRQFGRVVAVAAAVVLGVGFVAMSLFAANLTHYRPFQPQHIDIAPITAFLAKDNHSQWRYLTLGFGDQMAWLGANTTAKTVDGDYHSARALPELTSRPIERLEGAKYSGVPGIGSLQQFLATPGRYSLKYVFSNDDFYSPLLDASGWTPIGTLDDGVAVWERADVAPLPTATVSQQGPLWQRLMWGIIPPGSIVSAILTLAWALLGFPLPRLRGHTSLSTSPLPKTKRPTMRQALARRIDAVLDRAVARVPYAESPVPRQELRWLPGRAVLPTLRRWGRSAVSPSRRKWQALVVLAIVITILSSSAAVALTRRASVADVTAAYYENLDFRRFDAAYALLDPATRPSYGSYLRQLGADGGLVASFAKLNSVTSSAPTISGDRATTVVDRVYLTSLQLYRQTATEHLTQVGGSWRIDLAPANTTIPPDEFLSEPGVNYLSQGRRQLNDASTVAQDVLDRPQLSITDVRTLDVGGHWIVLGSVTNIDVVPADVTVEASLRSADGSLLATWDAGQVLAHKLRPGQSTVFRIEFQSLAGLGNYGIEADGGVSDLTIPASGGSSSGTPIASATTTKAVAPTKASTSAPLTGPVEFDPRVITPLVLPTASHVASVDVSARALVTPNPGSGSLQVLGMSVNRDVDGNWQLSGVIRNDGTQEASVPHLLLGYRGNDGRLLWVDDAYLPSSIGPQRSLPFQVPVPSSTELHDSGVPTTGYAGPGHETWPTDPSSLLTIPAATGFSSVSVTAITYSRAG
jgi:hypothetical protein